LIGFRLKLNDLVTQLVVIFIHSGSLTEVTELPSDDEDDLIMLISHNEKGSLLLNSVLQDKKYYTLHEGI
jgi:hypothetical protein